MTNSKSIKRALFSSVVALFLCFSMLLGTTFAWFTDSATTAVNTIIAGNLDIGVYYAFPEDVVNGDIPEKAWKAVSPDEAVFSKDALWEPGYTEAVFFKFKNEGSLALQYQLQVDILEETLGLNKKGEDIQLSNHINAYACNSFAWDYQDYLFTNRDDATDPAGAPNPYYDTLYNAANGDVATPNGDNPLSLDSWQWLEPDEVTYATLVLWMPTTVGNEANHNGEKIPEIDLGITVLATQYTFEKDSYDDQYDKDAEYPVADAEGLENAIAEGKDVKLESNITLIDPIAVSGNVSVDLNGYSLDASGLDSAFIVASGEDATITIEGTDEDVIVGKNGLVDIAEGANAVIEINGGNFVSDDAGSTLIKPNGDGEIKIVLNDVNYTSTADNGYVLDCSYYEGNDISVEINGGSFEATTGMLLPEGSSVKGAEITAHNTKNMQPAVYAMGDMTIENCIIKADKSHAVAVAGGATLNIIKCEVYAGSDDGALAFQVFSSGGTINVENTTYSGKYGTTGKMNAGCVAIINIDGVEKFRKG